MGHLKDAAESQFAYVVVVARRARQLLIGGRAMVDNPKSRKTTRIAEEELQKGLLEYDAPHLNEQAEDKDEKKRKA